MSESIHKLFIQNIKRSRWKPCSALEGAPYQSPCKSLPGITSFRKPCLSPDEIGVLLLGFLQGLGFYVCVSIRPPEVRTGSVLLEPGWEHGDPWRAQGPPSQSCRGGGQGGSLPPWGSWGPLSELTSPCPTLPFYTWGNRVPEGAGPLPASLSRAEA